MVAITNIRYRDIARAESDARFRLRARLEQLATSVQRGRVLSDVEQLEQARLKAVDAAVSAGGSGELCDPLFITVRDLFNISPGLLNGTVDNHADGVLRGFPGKAGAGSFTQLASCHAALTLGLLMIDGAADEAPFVVFRPAPAAASTGLEALKKRAEDAHAVAAAARQALADIEAKLANAAEGSDVQKQLKAELPRVRQDARNANRAAELAEKALSDATAAQSSGPAQRQIVAETREPGWAVLSKMFFAAIGEAQSMSSLAMLVLPILAMEGDPRGSTDNSPGQ
jgi:hypothetical protein